MLEKIKKIPTKTYVSFVQKSQLFLWTYISSKKNSTTVRYLLLFLKKNVKKWLLAHDDPIQNVLIKKLKKWWVPGKT